MVIESLGLALVIGAAGGIAGGLCVLAVALRAETKSQGRRRRDLARAAAERVIVKEIKAVTKNATPLAGEPAKWRAWLARFYDDHATFVAVQLQISQRVAENYCQTQRIILEERGVAALADWPTVRLAHLEATAVTGEEPTAVFRKTG